MTSKPMAPTAGATPQTGLGPRQPASVLLERLERLQGREEERAAVELLLTELRASPRLLLIAAEPGMGKTALWSYVVARAEVAGLRVLSARTAESELELPYTVLSDLLAPAVDASALAGLPPPLREALEVALQHRRERRNDPSGGRAVAQATLAILRSVAADGPLVIALDGLDWADRASRDALTFALRRLDREPIGVCATAVHHASFEGFEALWGREALDIRELGPLSQPAFHVVVGDRLTTPLPDVVLDRLSAATGGNPGAAVQIAEELRRRGQPLLRLDRFPVPEGLATPFRRLLDPLPERTRNLLLTAAVMSQPTLVELEAATAQPVLGGDGLDCPCVAGLVTLAGERVRFTHPLLPSVICDAHPVEQRREVHRRLADTMTNPDERARHLALAQSGADAAAARALTEAARRAAARGATTVAAELADEAVRFTPLSQQAAAVERRLLAAGYHADSGNLLLALPLLERAAAEAAGGPTRARTLHALGLARASAGQLGDSAALLDLAADEAIDDPELRALVLTDLAWTNIATGELHAASAVAASALRAAGGLGAGAGLAAATTVSAAVARLSGRARSAAALRNAAGMPGADRLPIASAPVLELARRDSADGRLDSARARVEALHRGVLLRGREGDVPQLLAELAWVENRAGRWAVALICCRDGLAAASRAQLRMPLTQLHAARAYALACFGQMTAATESAGQARELAEEIGDAGGLWRARWVLGFVSLSRGDLDGAAEQLGPVCAAARRAGLVDPSQTPWIPDAVETFIGLGEQDRAADLLAGYEDAAQGMEQAPAMLIADRCRGLLAAATGDRGEALACLERSVKGLERQGQPMETARSRLMLGLVQRRDRKPTLAQRSIEAAIAAFERLGALGWAGRARAELLTSATGGAGVLSPIEERVARLAAQGLTNREIAGQVHLSAKTVETHLSHAYRKLGIRSRTELGRHLG